MKRNLKNGNFVLCDTKENMDVIKEKQYKEMERFYKLINKYNNCIRKIQRNF